MSDWYYPDGTPMSSDSRDWSSREPGGMWDREHIVTKVPGGEVSTVWLGLDHSYNDGPPLIFESMAFCDGSLNNEGDRYATREAAREGHERMVARVTAERAAWDDLCADGRVTDCARVVVDALRAHLTEQGIDYGSVGEMFAALTSRAEANA